MSGKKEVVARLDMPVRGVKKGDKFEASEEEARALVRDGWIEAPEEEKKASKGDAKKASDKAAS